MKLGIWLRLNGLNGKVMGELLTPTGELVAVYESGNRQAVIRALTAAGIRHLSATKTAGQIVLCRDIHETARAPERAKIGRARR